MKITSINNDLVKEVAKLQQRKYRDESGKFLLEGEKCIQEAIKYGIEIEHIFVIEGYDNFQDVSNVVETNEKILSKISTTTTPPKCVAVGKQVERTWNKKYKKIVLLEDIKDAGNLGTILRTSCAFDIDAIILYGDTVDLYNPKCVRASVGNLWKIPVFNFVSTDDLKLYCKNCTPIATLPSGLNTLNLRDYNPPEKFVLMFGTESSGLSNELKNYAVECGNSITIEMSDKVESLNLSISTGIILYKFFKSF